MDIQSALARWHQVAANGSQPNELTAIMREDAIFHSPVVHTPQEGRSIVVAYLSAASQTLGNDSFRYVREVVGDDTVVLEFMTEMEGIKVNGIDMIAFDEEGRIKDFKVMVRPLKAVNKVWDMMAAELERQKA
ncbi:nuclear transport factor 2 family protein [Erythrobacter crassostreae]|uniref:Nuclear transport factor 2 family protein n=1 Tax=Erythrobacter crassostreae TaxID=2828328 RepID=A0A9X1F1F5_9SPHN|nr:nuclear transport factor 2 family protein [Erythrobacter crassostrea]MBV7258570.1 nuclear transport factor 2 family protein [Erythrobacter crassostrea]